MRVGLMISGGEFNRDITISVTTMEQSATGRFALLCSLTVSLRMVYSYVATFWCAIIAYVSINSRD